MQEMKRHEFDPCREYPLEKGMATHSSTLAWRIPWTEEPGGLQSMMSQRNRHDWATDTHKAPGRYSLWSRVLAIGPWTWDLPAASQALEGPLPCCSTPFLILRQGANVWFWLKRCMQITNAMRFRMEMRPMAFFQCVECNSLPDLWFYVIREETCWFKNRKIDPCPPSK